MGSGVKFKVDRAGVAEFLKSAPVANCLGDHADKVVSKANAAARPDVHIPVDDLYHAHVDTGRYTAIGKVAAAGKIARYDNARNNTLRKSIG